MIWPGDWSFARQHWYWCALHNLSELAGWLAKPPNNRPSRWWFLVILWAGYAKW